MRADRPQAELVEERPDLLRRDRPVLPLRVAGELHGLVAERGERLEDTAEATGERLPVERVRGIRVDHRVVEPGDLVAHREELDAELPRWDEALARHGARRPSAERQGRSCTRARSQEGASIQCELVRHSDLRFRPFGPRLGGAFPDRARSNPRRRRTGAVARRPRVGEDHGLRRPRGRGRPNRDMQIGKAGAPVSHIAQAYPDRVEVRGRDLTGDLMGRVSFTEYFHLLLTGREPTDDQRFFLDLLLVAIAEHGMMPTNVAARMTLAADPGSPRARSPQGSSAPGPSSSAPLRSARGSSRTLRRRSLAAATPRRSRETWRGRSTGGEEGPGVRASRPPAARPARGAHPRARRRPRREPPRAAGATAVRRRRRGVRQAADDERLAAHRGGDARPRLPVGRGQGVPILARTAGLLAHLAEEQEQPLGFQLAAGAEGAMRYEPGDERG